MPSRWPGPAAKSKILTRSSASISMEKTTSPPTVSSSRWWRTSCSWRSRAAKRLSEYRFAGWQFPSCSPNRIPIPRMAPLCIPHGGVMRFICALSPILSTVKSPKMRCSVDNTVENVDNLSTACACVSMQKLYMPPDTIEIPSRQNRAGRPANFGETRSGLYKSAKNG